MHWRGRSVRRALRALAVLAFSMVVIRAQEFDVAPPIPLWHRSVTLITGAGYKDNLLLSHSAAEESAFLKSGLELFVTRLPKEGPQFQFIASAEDLRFFSSPSVEKEQLVFAQARVVQELSATWEGSFDLEYVYLDQVVDLSATDPLSNVVRARGHQVQANPGVRHSFGETGRAELTFPVAKYWFAEPVDDYGLGGPKLTFEHPYGEKSEWTVSFSYSYWSYDDRPQSEVDGTLIPGTSLAFHQQRIDLAWRHYLDERNRWRVSTRLSYKQNQDNGPGFYDYIRFQGGEQIRFRTRTWDIAAEVKLAFYDYAKQRVSLTDRSVRERTEVGFNLRCEKELTRWLRLFAEYDYERIFSNRTIDEYSVNVASAGLMWEF